MKHIHSDEYFELQNFIKEAKQNFEVNPKNNSFSSSEIKAGCYLAMRWGLGADSMLVFKLSDDLEPFVIGNIIGDNQ